MDYQQAVSFLIDHFPNIKNRIEAYKPFPHRMLSLAIGWAIRRINSQAYIAGTNGKGSVAHMLAAVFNMRAREPVCILLLMCWIFANALK